MSENLRGILTMVIAMAMFSVGDTLFKVFGNTLAIGEMLFVRGIFATAIVLTAAHAMDALKDIRKVLTPAMALRVVCEVACSVLFFVALVRMQFSDAAAVGQFTPLMVMAGAAVFLGEPVGWRRWSAAGVGFLGVMMVIKPGTSAFQPMSVILLVSMAFVAARDLITRKLPKDVPTVLITLTSALGGMLVGPLMAPFETWRWFSLAETGVMLGCAVSVLLGYVFIILAMRHGDTAVVSPFRYSYMMFALLASLLVFNERPDLWSWLGIGLVVGSGLYTVHREQVRKRAAAAAASSARAAVAT